MRSKTFLDVGIAFGIVSAGSAAVVLEQESGTLDEEHWVVRFKKLADENPGVSRLQEAARAAR